MLLTDNIVQEIQNYNNLKRFHISTKWSTHICSQIFLNLLDTEICIDVEEQESYVSFIIRQVKDNKTYIYYALSDYSYNFGERIPLFASETDEKKFNIRVNQAINNRHKLFARDGKGDELVSCILSFLDKFATSIN